jgi:hypothetical protein
MRTVKDFSVIVPDLLGDKEFVEELGHSGSEMQWAVQQNSHQEVGGCGLPMPVIQPERWVQGGYVMFNIIRFKK